MEKSAQKISVEATRIFEDLPENARTCLQHIRREIFNLAKQPSDIGTIEESLKWGELSYAPLSPKTGTPVRLAYRPQSDKCALLVHCGTTVIDDFKQLPFENLEFEKNRALLFSPASPLPDHILRSFLKAAFTYHSRKKASV